MWARFRCESDESFEGWKNSKVHSTNSGGQLTVEERFKGQFKGKDHPPRRDRYNPRCLADQQPPPPTSNDCLISGLCRCRLSWWLLVGVLCILWLWCPHKDDMIVMKFLWFFFFCVKHLTSITFKQRVPFEEAGNPASFERLFPLSNFASSLVSLHFSVFLCKFNFPVCAVGY